MDYNYHLTPARLKIPGGIADKNEIAESLNNIAILFEKQGDISRALEYYFRELKVLEEINDKEGISLSLYNIGYIYEYLDDIQNALDYYKKSLIMGKELNDFNLIATILNNIGLIYLNLAQQTIKSEIRDIDSLQNKSMEYFIRALEIFREINDNEGIATLYQNIGMVYQGKNDHLTAKEYIDKSLELLEKINNKSA